jgi:hypothetical protein
MERRSPRLGAAIGAAFAAVQLGLILILAATAVIYGAVYIGRWADDVAYHIPGAVRIAKQLDPYHVDSPVDSHWYPSGAEAFAALFVAATSSINATNATGALCYLAVCLGTYLAAGLWSRARTVRLTCVLAAAALPILLAQTLAFYVDIHFALLTCAALWLQAASLVRRRALYAWLALGLAILATSVKYTGLTGLGVLLPGCVLCLYLAPPPRRPPWSIALLLAVSLAFSGGYYARNWMLRGNPLYPIDLPGWLRPLAALSPAPYEGDPLFLGGIATLQRSASLPHPWLPQSWTATKLKPDMTDDAFGGAGALALLGAALSLLALPRLAPGPRRAWLLVLVESAALLALFPLHGANPRYVLFLPVMAALSPAVLAAGAGRGWLRAGVGAYCAAIAAAAALFVWSNLLADTGQWTSLRQAAPLLFPYSPNGLRAVDWAQAGHLRIGYTSGFNNAIALLYDPHLTNELVPLHYKDFVLNHWREFDTPEAFIAHVHSLDLDHIEIFDPRYPGAELLQANFPKKVHIWQR